MPAAVPAGATVVPAGGVAVVGVVVAAAGGGAVVVFDVAGAACKPDAGADGWMFGGGVVAGAVGADGADTAPPALVLGGVVVDPPPCTVVDPEPALGVCTGWAADVETTNTSIATDNGTAISLRIAIDPS